MYIQSRVREERKEMGEEKAEGNELLNKDATLISNIKKSALGKEFKNLYSGAMGNNEKAQRKLLAILNFFTNSNLEQMQRIFMGSKLYDAKKGVDLLTTVIEGIVNKSNDFISKARATTKIKQATNTATNSASK